MISDCTITLGKRTYIEISNNRVILHDRVQQKLLNSGIAIPFQLRKDFENKNYIYPSDTSFARAIIEVYYPQQLKKSGFQLHIQEQQQEIAAATEKMKSLAITQSRRDGEDASHEEDVY